MTLPDSKADTKNYYSLVILVGFCASALIHGSPLIAQSVSAGQTANSHFASGYDRLKTGDASGSIDEFNTGLAMDPDNVMALFYLAEAELALGNKDQAGQLFLRCATLDPAGQYGEKAKARLRESGTDIPQTATAVANRGRGPLRAKLAFEGTISKERTTPNCKVSYSRMNGKFDVVPCDFKDAQFELGLRESLRSDFLQDLVAVHLIAEPISVSDIQGGPDDIIFEVELNSVELQLNVDSSGGGPWTVSAPVVFAVKSGTQRMVSKSKTITGSVPRVSTGLHMFWTKERYQEFLAANSPPIVEFIKTAVNQAFADFLESAPVDALIHVRQPNLNATSPPRSAPSVSPLQSLSPGEQQHYADVFKSGRPSQMYLLAVKMYTDNHTELGDNLCQAIVDRYPDDPYAAKAIDRLDSARQAAQKLTQQREVLAQQQAVQTQQGAQVQEAAQKRTNACHLQCQAQRTSCESRVSAQSSQSIAGALTGILTHSTGQVLGSVAGSGSGEDCSSDWLACDAGC